MLNLKILLLVFSWEVLFFFTTTNLVCLFFCLNLKDLNHKKACEGLKCKHTCAFERAWCVTCVGYSGNRSFFVEQVKQICPSPMSRAPIQSLQIVFPWKHTTNLVSMLSDSHTKKETWFLASVLHHVSVFGLQAKWVDGHNICLKMRTKMPSPNTHKYKTHE